MRYQVIKDYGWFGNNNGEEDEIVDIFDSYDAAVERATEEEMYKNYDDCFSFRVVSVE